MGSAVGLEHPEHYRWCYWNREGRRNRSGPARFIALKGLGDVLFGDALVGRLYSSRNLVIRGST